jgi:hypothetical protein
MYRICYLPRYERAVSYMGYVSVETFTAIGRWLLKSLSIGFSGWHHLMHLATYCLSYIRLQKPPSHYIFT